MVERSPSLGQSLSKYKVFYLTTFRALLGMVGGWYVNYTHKYKVIQGVMVG